MLMAIDNGVDEVHDEDDDKDGAIVDYMWTCFALFGKYNMQIEWFNHLSVTFPVSNYYRDW